VRGFLTELSTVSNGHEARVLHLLRAPDVLVDRDSLHWVNRVDLANEPRAVEDTHIVEQQLQALLYAGFELRKTTPARSPTSPRSRCPMPCIRRRADRAHSRKRSRCHRREKHAESKVHIRKF
jgi:hypothetical protein